MPGLTQKRVIDMHEMKQDQLISVLATLIERDVAEAAKVVEDLPAGDGAALLSAVPVQVGVRLINRLQSGFAGALLEQCEVEEIKKLLINMPAQQAAAIVMHLSVEKRGELLPEIKGRLVDNIRELLTYPEGSVGRYMSMDMLTFKKDESAGAVIDRLRKLSVERKFPASYAYVVDEDNVLQGVLNTRTLFLAEPSQRLESIMITSVFALHCFTDRSDAAREMASRKYFAAPVVDGENRLLGVIKAENMLRGIKEDLSGDMQKMFGVGGDERVFSSIGFALKKRLLWLTVNLGTAFLAAAVVALFQGIIAKLTILAVFLPVIAGQGGNAGAQSLAVVMRGLVMREIPPAKVPALILKETKLGAINGLVIGIITAVIAYVWYGNYWLGVVIGLGMIINLIIAGLAGSSIPIIMKRIGIDPAQSSSIILTTVTDVMGFLAFLGHGGIVSELSHLIARGEAARNILVIRTVTRSIAGRADNRYSPPVPGCTSGSYPRPA
jgi:magnesium transporter